MRIDRDLWSAWFTSAGWPEWQCPRCHSGVLQLDRKSFVEKETADSIKAGRGQDWDPACITNRFVAWLRCSKANCRDVASVLGISGVDPVQGPEGELDWEEVYSPRIVSPMPDIFPILPACPERVAKELRAAFALFWIDPAAAANRLRIALEQLLDSASVKRRRRVPGAIQDLNLHQRIEEYQKREPVISAHLMAVKWLGNTASHESGISQVMLLDAFEIFQHALEEIVEERSHRVTAIAHKMTKEHAPKRKRSKKKNAKQPPKG